MKHKGLVVILSYFGISMLLGVYQMFAALVFQLPMEEEMKQNIVLNFLCFVILIVVIAVIYRRSIQQSMVTEFSNIKNVGKHLLVSAVVFVLMAIAMMLSTALLTYYGFTSMNQQSLMDSQQLNPILMNIQIVVLAPIIEETIFRGIVYNWLYRRIKWGALIVSALIFGFLHIMVQLGMMGPAAFLVMIPYFLLGLGLAIAYKRTNCLIYPILIHMIWNLIGLLV